MTVPNWDIFGSTMVSSQQIRLTADVQSRRGAIWNKIVCSFFGNFRAISFIYSLFNLVIGSFKYHSGFMEVLEICLVMALQFGMCKNPICLVTSSDRKIISADWPYFWILIVTIMELTNMDILIFLQWLQMVAFRTIMIVTERILNLVVNTQDAKLNSEIETMKLKFLFVMLVIDYR